VKVPIIREISLRVSDDNFMQLQHFILSQDSLKVDPTVLIVFFFGWDFAIRTVSMEMGISGVSSVFESLSRVPYYKVLTKLQCV